MQLHGPTDNTRKYGSILLIGEPKVGKTLLASTAPHPYFLDIENGASSTGAYRATFTRDAAGFKAVKAELARLAALRPGPDGLLHHTAGGTKFQVGTIVIDSIDELQLVADMTINATGLRYWGEMLNLLRGVITIARRANAHLIVIAHTRDTAEEGSEITKVGLALQGGIRSQIMRWFDCILHLADIPGKGTTVFTNTTTVGKRSYVAGDRHYIFKGKQFPLRWVGGKPDPKTMATILAATTGGEKVVGADPSHKVDAAIVHAESGFTPATLKDWAGVYEGAAAHLGYTDVDTAKAALKQITAGDHDMLRGKDRKFDFPAAYQLLKEHKLAVQEGAEVGAPTDTPDDVPASEAADGGGPMSPVELQRPAAADPVAPGEPAEQISMKEAAALEEKLRGKEKRERERERQAERLGATKNVEPQELHPADIPDAIPF